MTTLGPPLLVPLGIQRGGGEQEFSSFPEIGLAASSFPPSAGASLWVRNRQAHAG